VGNPRSSDLGNTAAFSRKVINQSGNISGAKDSKKKKTRQLHLTLVVMVSVSEERATFSLKERTFVGEGRDAEALLVPGKN